MEEIARSFQAACARQGIKFIDMREDFILFYQATGRFPRGFPNTRPSRGHFNAEGIGLVADAVVRELRGSILP